MKILKIAIGVLLLGFLVIQLFRPDRTNPKVDPARTIQALMNPPADVMAILDRSCGDCHSSHTRWPWYTNVAPVSWFVAGHVKEGRQHLNLDDWAKVSPDRWARKARGLCNITKKNAMPLASYLIIHKDAKVSDADKQTLCAWADSLQSPG
jgi:hypothetical protein